MQACFWRLQLRICVRFEVILNSVRFDLIEMYTQSHKRFMKFCILGIDWNGIVGSK